MSSPGSESHLMVNIRYDFLIILRFLWKVTFWNQDIWSLVVSNIILSHSWYPRKSPYVSWFICNIIDFWWFLVDFLCSHLRRVVFSLLGFVHSVISAALRVPLAVTWFTVYHQLEMTRRASTGWAAAGEFTSAEEKAANTTPWFYGINGWSPSNFSGSGNHNWMLR